MTTYVQLTLFDLSLYDQQVAIKQLVLDLFPKQNPKSDSHTMKEAA
jgi:hypothetical protein